MNKTLVKWIRKIGATVFFLGYLPWMPGTVGSALVAVLAWIAYSRFGFRFDGAQVHLYMLAAVALTAAGFFVCSGAREIFGSDDPPRVIFDECVGQAIAYFMIPLSARTIVLGFLLFRFFDIVKPYPVYYMEDLEDGVGITMDDVVAGICANATLLVILYGYYFVKAAL